MASPEPSLAAEGGPGPHQTLQQPASPLLPAAPSPLSGFTEAPVILSSVFPPPAKAAKRSVSERR